jgi:sulfide dehydrogenase cytochrome subunit
MRIRAALQYRRVSGPGPRPAVVNRSTMRKGIMRRKHGAVRWLLICAGIWAGSMAQASAAAGVDKLVAVCANCHGKDGASTEHDIPIIGGYSADFLVNNLKAYQAKDRDCPETKIRAGAKKGTKTSMCEIAKNLTGAEIRQIADFFTAQKFVPAKQAFDADLARRGKKVHDQYCEKCHTDGGTHSEDDAGMPAGQWIAYLEQAFDEFLTGKRPIPKKMKVKLDQVDKDDIRALVQYYASIQ